jgi:predicted MFS family arabinose efflux permease
MVDDARRGTLLALTVAVGQIGIGIGGAIAGPVYSYSGFFSSTVLAAISLVAMAVLVAVWLPEPGRSVSDVDVQAQPGP